MMYTNPKTQLMVVRAIQYASQNGHVPGVWTPFDINRETLVSTCGKCNQVFFIDTEDGSINMPGVDKNVSCRHDG